MENTSLTSDSLGEFVSKTIQDTSSSSLFPVLVQPWTVNKVTCGSLLTFLDNSISDVTVSFDACLVALLLLNIFIFGPLLFADVTDQFSNIFFSFQDRIDRIESALGLENHFEAYKNPTFLENIISTMHNNTYLDSPIESLQNLTRRIDIGNPFDKIEELTTFLQNMKDFTSDSEESSSDDNGNEIDDNYYLKSNRVPINVYKYPVDGSFGSIFQGFETLKDEVLDLSKASPDELKEYYSLPRSF